MSIFFDENDVLCCLFVYFKMNESIEYHRTTTQRGAEAIQIGTDLYRMQKKNKNGTVRWICTHERCNASFTMNNEQILEKRGVHSHSERNLPFHIGEEVKKFYAEAEIDLKTPVPRLYDQAAKKFVSFSKDEQ